MIDILPVRKNNRQFFLFITGSLNLVKIVPVKILQ